VLVSSAAAIRAGWSEAINGDLTLRPSFFSVNLEFQALLRMTLDSEDEPTMTNG